MKTIFAFALAGSLAVSAHASFTLPEGRVCADVPFDLQDNRAVFEMLVEGKGPYRFIFDTGANSILDAALARELGVALDDIGQTGGAGAGTQATWRTRLKHVAFGGVTGKDADFMALDLSEIRKAIGFSRLDGLMGREILAAFLVRYDYGARTIAICDSGNAPAEMRSGHKVAIDIGEWAMPELNATLDGRPGRFVIDTGDRSALTLFGPYASANKLRDAYRPRVRTITGRGVGGPIPADVVRAGTFAFGGLSVQGVTTRMPLLTSGAFASDRLAGSIGNGIMRQWNVAFDYSGKAMYLTPNSAQGAAARSDRSGMWLVGHDAGFEVLSVVDDGPAAQSGLSEGDLVTHVDGQPALSLSLIAVRDRLMDAAAGTRVEFTIRRKNETTAKMAVVLRDLLGPR